MKKYTFNQYLKFYRYLNDVKGFYPYIDELKKYVFQLKKTHVKSAKNSLLYMFKSKSYGLISASYQSIQQLKTKYTLVSIHVRLGDYEKHLKNKFGLPIIADAYFTRAMKFILEKYPVRRDKFYPIQVNLKYNLYYRISIS